MDVLHRRALNRATLARQHLLDRVRMPAEDMVSHLVGMQAQAPNPPYLGLWTRLDGFRLDELAELVTARRVVRIALMRGTIHLVTAGDCLLLRVPLQPVLDRGLQGTFGRALAGVDPAEVAAAGRALVEEEPLTFDAIGRRLADRWPGVAPLALANAVRAGVALVQVPPRGLWGRSGQAKHTSVESWLGGPVEPDSAPDAMVLRYLAAFGPATVADMQKWSGLTGLREVVERQRSRLRGFRDGNGRDLYDLPDAPRPDPDTPAPVRYLPEFDNLLLSHEDRTRVMTEEDRARVMSVNGIVAGTVLVDGFVHGHWKIHRARGSAVLRVTPFRRLTKRDAAAVAAEGERLLAFAAAEAKQRDLELLPLP
jgi:hypothetical protein